MIGRTSDEVRQKLAVAAILAGIVVAFLAWRMLNPTPPGQTTCGQFVRMSPAERMQVIERWSPGPAASQQRLARATLRDCSRRGDLQEWIEIEEGP